MTKVSKNLGNTELLIPKNDLSEDSEIEVSIVVPALNEQITIGEFVDWCFEGIKNAGVSAEIIIVDSSSDKTPDIALSKGARVLRTPKRGLGQAYIDAIPYIRGKFIIMGDCDLTYDFREIRPFVESYRSGNQFVMGSRFSGSIEEGAMPALHRYFGTPLTTWILNRIYHSRYSDIHCGMRGLTKEALIKINLSSKGWEYASEMVLKASRINLKVDEVPVKFYKDREGRFSHHRRAGFWSPWYAGWINLKVMLVYSPDSFLIKPGILFTFLGILISFFSYAGTISLFGFGFNHNMMLLGSVFTILGTSSISTGVLVRLMHTLRGGFEVKVLDFIGYDKGIFFSFILGVVGLLIEFDFLKEYLVGSRLIEEATNTAIVGSEFLILGFQLFTFTLILEMIRRLNMGRDE